MSTLSLRGINKIYPNNVQAVFDFNLEIKDKEFIVFVGPSGCGKSTTLRMVAGLEEITSGELYIDGKLANDIVPKNRDIAMVFQSYALYPHMTVFGNMAFSLKLRRPSMPIYITENEDPRIGELRQANKVLWSKIRKLDRKFKKNQNDLSVLEPRAALFQELYKNLDEIASLRVQAIGIDELGISEAKKTVEKLTKEIGKLEKKLSAVIEDKERDVLENGIAQRKRQIEQKEEEAKYLSEHEVPLRKKRRLTKEEIAVEVNKTAASIDLIRYLYRKPAALSGGQRQRVALGRAIVRKPKVFLMDEPLSNLDAKLRVQTRSEIAKIHERVGATTIYVTHDQTEAMTMADRIVIMKDGYIQQIGAPEEVYGDPDNMFVAGFIGSPAMNFITVTKKGSTLAVVPHKGQTGDLLSGEETQEQVEIPLPKQYASLLKDYEGKELVLGIRPEDIYLKGDRNNEHPSPVVHYVCDFAELLGYESVLYVYLCGQKIVLKTDVKNRIKTHDELDACFDEGAYHFFDKESGLRIR